MRVNFVNLAVDSVHYLFILKLFNDAYSTAQARHVAS
jgi:hypothetical protein